ncbi:PREDICTED: uncharacterized protein LOC104612736 [Nelumbo nucifera]|uniref:Uncharacterized protein n=2 Tax=Nelumbo nucifera TaxID=4432 RepID=A0A822ZX90_NELNU|nr:PREDICTED: uncharacterized protein LOC104612736 [Nelumbo nucifera]DAD47975.1 TPA_asm: hypothetical protein HUJ06_017912 [Nelumbo nucifera]
MEISAIADPVTVIATQGLGVAKFHLRRSALCNISSYDASSLAGILSISARFSPVDVMAPPTVRSNSYRAAPRTLTRQKRRTRRRSLTGDFDIGEKDGFFGDGGDGPFGGGSGGGNGGRGLDFDRFGGSDWEESSSSSSSDPAFDFVYEVLCWFVLSNCMHFAFKRMVRTLAGGIGDPSREKVSMRLVSVC